VFKLVVTEVRNFPEIAEFYQQRGGRTRPQRLVSSIVLERHGAWRVPRLAGGPWWPTRILLPLVMLCIHKHSLGVCCPGRMALDGPGGFHPAAHAT
jgi:hypothetical protein